MPRIKVHLRIAESNKGYGEYVIKATARPSYAAITDTRGYAKPTVAFAVVLDVPVEAFKRAEAVLAELDVPEEAVKVAAEVADEPG